MSFTKVFSSFFAITLLCATLVSAPDASAIGRGSSCINLLTSPVQPVVKLNTPKHQADFKLDWAAFISWQRNMGFSDSTIQQKIDSKKFSSSDTILLFREVTGNKKWDFGDEIPDVAYGNLRETHMNKMGILGFWMLIPNFSASKLIQALGENPSNISSSSFFLTEWAYLLLDTKNGLEIAKAVWSSRYSMSFASLAFPRLSEKDRDAFGNFISDGLIDQLKNQDEYYKAKWLLDVLHYIPNQYIPDEVMAQLEAEFVSNEEYPPLQMGSIGICASGNKSAGNCEYMTHGHLATLGLTIVRGSDFKNNVLIWVEGNLIGSLKLTGDPSMIALRNVVDKDGRVVLAIGAAYRLPEFIVDHVREASKSDGDWNSVSLDQLTVEPHDFVPNGNAWSNLNMKDLMAISALSNSSIDGIIGDALSFVTGLFNSDPERAYKERFSPKVRASLINSLNRIRVKIEERNAELIEKAMKPATRKAS